MSELTGTPQIALARVDDLLNKVFVAGLALLTLDTAQNALRQMHLLNLFWFWLTFGSLIVSVFGAILAAYVFGKTRYWYRAMAIVVLFTMLTWNYQMLDSQVLPEDFKPWIWWALGPAALATVGAWSKRWAYLSLIIAPVVWLMVETSEEGGAIPLGLAIQDSLYTLFFSTALGLLAIVIKDRAMDVDRENGFALDALLNRTRAKVLNRERALYNSIMHDKVLAALELAASASNERAKKRAVAAAEEAIRRLQREAARAVKPPENVAIETIIEPMRLALERQYPKFKFVCTGTNNVQIGFQAVVGIYEATLLAAGNSMTHAPGATERKVRVRLSANGIKVLVTDNGRGFRMSNVHKTALGVRWTIFRRLESFGVKASLETTPGKGTTWIFEWYQ